MFPIVPGSQTITLQKGLTTYATLTNGSVVTMSNRCELHVTATIAPITGCLIHLNSSDAWFFLDGIKPSVAVSTYLSQVRISGAVAVADSNCRVVQYALGTVIIPHATSFQFALLHSHRQRSGHQSEWNKQLRLVARWNPERE